MLFRSCKRDYKARHQSRVCRNNGNDELADNLDNNLDDVEDNFGMQWFYEGLCMTIGYNY